MVESLRRNEVVGDRSSGGAYWQGEPRVEDLLRDPVLQLVMRRDQVGEEDLAQLIQGVRRNLRQT